MASTKTSPSPSTKPNGVTKAKRVYKPRVTKTKAVKPKAVKTKAVKPKKVAGVKKPTQAGIGMTAAQVRKLRRRNNNNDADKVLYYVSLHHPLSLTSIQDYKGDKAFKACVAALHVMKVTDARVVELEGLLADKKKGGEMKEGGGEGGEGHEGVGEKAGEMKEGGGEGGEGHEGEAEVGFEGEEKVEENVEREVEMIDVEA